MSFFLFFLLVFFPLHRKSLKQLKEAHQSKSSSEPPKELGQIQTTAVLSGTRPSHYISQTWTGTQHKTKKTLTKEIAKLSLVLLRHRTFQKADDISCLVFRFKSFSFPHQSIDTIYPAYYFFLFPGALANTMLVRNPCTRKRAASNSMHIPCAKLEIIFFSSCTISYALIGSSQV